MGYVIGVDLGTTYSAAATTVDGRSEIFSLGTRSPAIPSVVVLRDDGEILYGEAAERRAVLEPARTAREFKRRLGDPAPILLGGTPYGAETLTGYLLRGIVRSIQTQRGERPEVVVLTHPANYGEYKLDLLREAARIADVGEVRLLPEPVAAAIHYATLERVEPGQVVAVYDFGGGTFDAAVLRLGSEGFDLLGAPQGLERLGGLDFDEAVFRHVTGALGEAASGLDSSDPSVRAALTKLREECQRAKETLSSDTDTAIPVMLPSIHTEVRITRPEFEDMIRPRIRDTLASIERTVVSAGLSFSDLARVLLVGGSSRIPLVGEMVREATDRSVAADAHPKHTIPLGGATWGGEQSSVLSRDASVLSPAPAEPSVPAAQDRRAKTAAMNSTHPPRTRRSRRWLIPAILLVTLLLSVGVGAALVGGGDGVKAAGDTDQAASEPAEEPAELTPFEEELVGGWSRYHSYDGSSMYLLFNADRTACDWEVSSSGSNLDEHSFTYWDLRETPDAVAGGTGVTLNAGTEFLVFYGDSPDDDTWGALYVYDYAADEIRSTIGSELIWTRDPDVVTCFS